MNSLKLIELSLHNTPKSKEVLCSPHNVLFKNALLFLISRHKDTFFRDVVHDVMSYSLTPAGLSDRS